jgi:hypothetical protein
MAKQKRRELTPDERKRRDDADAAMLDHAVRMWKAECDNAERIEGRTRLLGGAVFAVLGLGLYRVDWFYDPDLASRVYWPLAECLIKSLLVLGLLCLVMGLLVLFLHRGVQRLTRTSSELLAFRPEDQGKAVRRVAYNRTYDAAMDLQARNLERWERLDRGQVWLQRGVALVLLSVLMYICLSAPPVRGAQGSVDHAGSTTTIVDEARR